MLRTAAGSTPGPSQIKRWQQLGVRMVVADANPLSVGFYFADRAYTVPYANDPTYLEHLLEICAKEKVDAFLPSLDEEMVLVGEARDEFKRLGTEVMVASNETLRICTDKLETYAFFSEHHIPTVFTQSAQGLQAQDITAYPQIVKPRRGRGSSGVFRTKNWEEISFFSRYIGDAVVQPCLSGVEYTIDVLADRDHQAAIIAPRKRVATDSGISSKGVTAWHGEMAEWVGKIVTDLRLVGPANIQCFVTPTDEIAFTEVNARLAGSSILSIAAGVPLLDGVIDLLLGRPPARFMGPLPEERVMLRYWEELFLSPEEAGRFGWRDGR